MFRVAEMTIALAFQRGFQHPFRKATHEAARPDPFHPLSLGLADKLTSNLLLQRHQNRYQSLVLLSGEPSAHHVRPNQLHQCFYSPACVLIHYGDRIQAAID
jgi:hypothetical protein